jgi:hypothetical protein
MLAKIEIQNLKGCLLSGWKLIFIEFEELFWHLDGLIGSNWKKKVITTSPHHKNKQNCHPKSW